MRLIALFVLTPLLELALLVEMGKLIGLLPTVAMVVFTGILGASLARTQGLATLSRLRSAIAEGRLPHLELAEGALILLAGAVLLTPGLITDLVGFSLLIPALRSAVARALIERFSGHLEASSGIPFRVGGPTPSPDSGDAKVVDVEYTVAEDPER